VHRAEGRRPVTRWVICPDRFDGSLAAETVEPDAWEEQARAMSRREDLTANLYEVTETGAWSLKGRVNDASSPRPAATPSVVVTAAPPPAPRARKSRKPEPPRGLLL